MNQHVTKSFLHWHEKRLSIDERQFVDRHLGECPSCKAYFEKMSFLLSSPDPEFVPRLEVDGLLLEDIRKSLRREAHNPDTTTVMAWAQWSLRAAAVFAALITGVLLSRGWEAAAANQKKADQEIMTAFYEEFSQQSMSDSWQTIVEVENANEN